MYQELLPEESVMHFSYVLGTAEERENRTVLSRDELKKRLKHVIENKSEAIEVNSPQHLQSFEKYRIDVLKRAMLQHVKTEPSK